MNKYSDELIDRYISYMKKRCNKKVSKEEAKLHLDNLAGLYSLLNRQI